MMQRFVVGALVAALVGVVLVRAQSSPDLGQWSPNWQIHHVPDVPHSPTGEVLFFYDYWDVHGVSMNMVRHHPFRSGLNGSNPNPGDCYVYVYLDYYRQVVVDRLSTGARGVTIYDTGSGAWETHSIPLGNCGV